MVLDFNPLLSLSLAWLLTKQALLLPLSFCSLSGCCLARQFYSSSRNRAQLHLPPGLGTRGSVILLERLGGACHHRVAVGGRTLGRLEGQETRLNHRAPSPAAAANDLAAAAVGDCVVSAGRRAGWPRKSFEVIILLFSSIVNHAWNIRIKLAYVCVCLRLPSKTEAEFLKFLLLPFDQLWSLSMLPLISLAWFTTHTLHQKIALWSK